MTKARLKSLPAPGDRLKTEILERYELNAAELAILDQAAALTDQLARINIELAGQDLLGTGSRGQVVANALLETQRRHSETLWRLLDALRLPSVDEDEGESQTIRNARRAAQVRWTREKGNA